MSRTDLVVIGGSAGAIKALLHILDDLPEDFPAAILVVIHIPARGSGLLPTVIQRRSALPVAYAEDGVPIAGGEVRIAPPDRHLVVTPTGLRLVRGAREHRHRPAIDPLFRSAAEAFGPRVTGLILSGAGSDGAAGMGSIRHHGGHLLVQDPDDALMPIMPQAVLDAVEVRAQLPAHLIAGELTRLVAEPVLTPEEIPMPAHERQPRFEETSRERDAPGSPSIFSCPDCGGVLWEQNDGALTEFRCRVGHAYSSESLLDAQQDIYEDALWMALRALEEKADLFSGMARQAEERGRARLRDHFVERRAELQPHIEALRTLLSN